MTTAFWCRHGEHKNNKLTPKGVKEVKKAATWAANKMKDEDLRSVVVASSELGRAVESLEIYIQALVAEGIHVDNSGPVKELNPAMGILTAHGEQKTPLRYGQGFMYWWRNCPDNELPEGCETFEDAGQVPGKFVADYIETCSGNAAAILTVSHGAGTVEPGVQVAHGITLNDLPSAAVVKVDNDRGYSIYDPNVQS